MLAGGEDLPDLRVVQLVGARDVHDLDVVREQLLEGAVRLRDPQVGGPAPTELRARSRSPATRTPIRRSASMCTVPMNPVPMTAALIVLRPAISIRPTSSMGAAVPRGRGRAATSLYN